MPNGERAEEPDRSEEEQERLNRQMGELLNEIRVAMPGVQVLFAFLLAVPFQQHEKPNIVRTGTRQFILGLLALAVSMNCAVLLVTDVLFRAPTVVVTVVLLASLFAWLWFGYGVWRRIRR